MWKQARQWITRKPTTIPHFTHHKSDMNEPYE